MLHVLNNGFGFNSSTKDWSVQFASQVNVTGVSSSFSLSSTSHNSLYQIVYIHNKCALSLCPPQDGTTASSINYGWALGYMLLRTQDIPLSPYYLWRPYTVVDLVVGIIVLAILCFVFIVFFVFTCTACHRALKTTTAGYSNIA